MKLLCIFFSFYFSVAFCLFSSDYFSASASLFRLQRLLFSHCSHRFHPYFRFASRLDVHILANKRETTTTTKQKRAEKNFSKWFVLPCVSRWALCLRSVFFSLLALIFVSSLLFFLFYSEFLFSSLLCLFLCEHRRGLYAGASAYAWFLKVIVVVLPVRMKLLYVKRSYGKWKQLNSGKYDMQNTKWNMFGLSSLLWPRPLRPATPHTVCRLPLFSSSFPDFSISFIRRFFGEKFSRSIWNGFLRSQSTYGRRYETYGLASASNPICSHPGVEGMCGKWMRTIKRRKRNEKQCNFTFIPALSFAFMCSHLIFFFSLTSYSGASVYTLEFPYGGKVIAHTVKIAVFIECLFFSSLNFSDQRPFGSLLHTTGYVHH